ncbi:MAG TPA: hypothetical protein VNO30_39715 [Kofleriaceae bacterium]|nr:hypothetical protein [Kofleriaceae bacterium]
MQPFGHSIPGEPWIPVDAYRDIVRTEAVAMGIPLRDSSLPRNSTPAWLRHLLGESGVYVILARDGLERSR